METKKSVLFLMNGFGLEVPRSFNMYKASLMPSLAKISNYYPFAGVFASGTEVGLNKGQLSSFRVGYSVFSAFGKPNKKLDVIQAKMDDTSFYTSPVISQAIDYSLKNGSKLHVLFSIGERTEDSQMQQLKNFCIYAYKRGVKDICIHLFLGDNSVKGMKVSAPIIKTLKYNIFSATPNCRIVSIAGRKYLTDAKKDEIIAILPSIHRPSVAYYQEEDMVSLSVVMDEKRLWDILERLKELGAKEILICPIDKMIL